MCVTKKHRLTDNTEKSEHSERQACNQHLQQSLQRNEFEELTRSFVDIVDSLVVASFVHALPIALLSCDNHME